MTTPRTRAILEVPRRGREDRFAQKVLRVFGASTMDQALPTYDAVGAAERATLDEAVERVTADDTAAFRLSGDVKTSYVLSLRSAVR